MIFNNFLVFKKMRSFFNYCWKIIKNVNDKIKMYKKDKIKMYNFVQNYFTQIVHFCIDNNILKEQMNIKAE